MIEGSKPFDGINKWSLSMNGKNAEQAGHSGLEYWKSRSNMFFEAPGRWTKNMTHRYERRMAKLVIEEEVNEWRDDESIAA